MIFKVIIFVIISCLTGVKRPIYGGLAGLISAPVMSLIFSPFDLPTVLVLIPFGFGFGLLCGRVSWWIFHDSDSNQQNTKPHVMPITKAGGGQRGEIIYTDEEAKNAEDNKRMIK
ncbi:MAG: hypothetical protein ACR2PH_06410 [Desulfobulbia bacterium]